MRALSPLFGKGAVLRLVAGAIAVGLITAQCSAHRANREREGGADASDAINKGILDAIKHGRHEYDLPAGTFEIGHTILVPRGTHDFTLAGAGSGSTKIVTTYSKLLFAVQVGEFTWYHNNWPIRQRNPIAVQPLNTGDTVIHPSAGGGSFRAGDYGVLWDYDVVQTSKQPFTTLYNHGEIVRIKSAVGGGLGLDTGVGREYDASAQLTRCSDTICTNITVKGLTIDGAAAGGALSNDCLCIGIADGVKVSDVHAVHFSNRAIETNIVRNAVFENDDVSGGTNIGNPGSGYGMTICRSRFIKVVNCTGELTRHAFCVHSGTTDVDFVDCKADPLPNEINDFNDHGFDERRIHYLRCVGSLNFGNPAWLAGCRDFTVDNCTSLQSIYFGPNAKNIVVQNSTVGPTVFDAEARATGLPNNGQPDNVKIVDCKILGNRAVNMGGKFGRAEYDNCDFEQDKQDWGLPIAVKQGAEGTLIFNKCRFVNRSVRDVDTLVSLEDAPAATVTFTNCEFHSLSGAQTAIEMRSGSINLKLSNNDFYSSNPKRPIRIFDPQKVPGADAGGNRIHPVR